VGSRDRRGDGNEYCSRICCMYTAKQAHLVKEKIPDANVTVFYTDVRAYGRGYEEFYVSVRNEGVEYKRRELEDPIEVVRKEGEDKLVVRAICEGCLVEREADLVVLATGMVPRAETAKISSILKLSRKKSGFFLEAHPKLRPVDTLTDGIFLAGCCQYPKDIQDSVAQASATASRACIILSKKEIEIEGIVATVDRMKCVGCGICASMCPYGAIEVVKTENGKKAMVIEVKCKGCGICASSCIKRAINIKHFSNEQLIAQERGALGWYNIKEENVAMESK
ncbi:MAG: 4Fe-4S binding protein, partial [Candidatus Methanospirareceae archaeon]